jgi:hypothetical protein
VLSETFTQRKDGQQYYPAIELWPRGMVVYDVGTATNQLGVPDSKVREMIVHGRADVLSECLPEEEELRRSPGCDIRARARCLHGTRTADTAPLMLFPPDFPHHFINLRQQVYCRVGTREFFK